MKKLLTIINGFFHKIFQVLELYSQVVLLAIVLVLTILYFKAADKRVHYQ